MPEITVTGANELTFPVLSTWGWEIAIYLFLGGLVAGVMIFAGVMRLTRGERFSRALLVADLAALPLLGVGMFLLMLDLSNKVNLWRFYTTFQVASPMSWGAWILLVTMVMLALRFVSRVPRPRPMRVLGITVFAPEPVGQEEIKAALAKKPSALAGLVESAWNGLYGIACQVVRRDRALALLGVVLGIGVGFYTGVLLSSIAARPLWNTAVLAPFFLVSGLGTGGAFLCLFLPEDEHAQIVPFSVLLCGVEIVLLAAYVLNLAFGTQAMQRAGAVLFGGNFGIAFWGIVLLVGLVLPAVIEQLELMHRRIPLLPSRVPPVLKLTGGIALRFVIVYAGLLSFV